MPRNVRNFWIELSVDGRSSKIAAGPVNKNGGFELTIKQRDKGGIKDAFTIIGREHNGELITRVYGPDGAAEAMRVETSR